MSSTATVRTWFETQLATVTGMPALALQGNKFKNEAGTPWARFTLLPAETQMQSIGSNPVATLQGLAQADLFWPQMRGITDVETVAQAVVATFSPGVYVVAGEQIVIDNVWVEAVQEEPGWTHLPVVMRWRAFRV